MHPFLNGVSACGRLLAGLLFLKVSRHSHERLFLCDEGRSLYFAPRLPGFVLMLAGIVGKNRKRAE